MITTLPTFHHASPIRFHQRGTMAKDDKRVQEANGVVPERDGARPDFTVSPPRKALPKGLQDMLDNDEKLVDVLYDGT